MRLPAIRATRREIYSVRNMPAVKLDMGRYLADDRVAKSKKQRRLAAKALRKQQLLDPESMAPKVPLYEQSVDLPKGDGTVASNSKAGEARQELTKAMRENRRSKIKEANFLKEMR